MGRNRDLAGKPIGVRTLGLVSLGAAVVSVAGIQVPGMAENSDAFRAGISFVGAGVILRNAQAGTVEGLTTAATVWLSAALGVACGLGAWRTIAVALPLSLLLLFAGRWLEGPWKRSGRRDDEGN